MAAIERLLSAFAWHADRGEGALLSELFLPDGTLSVGGNELKGRAAIADDCHRRALVPGRKTRHVWSNLRIQWVAEDVVATSAIQLTIEQVGTDNPSTQMRVNDVFDKFQQDTEGAWYFASRIIRREMSLVI
jgi:hypothetical protein